MSVFRIEKTKDFTIMSNHHLRNAELSLKAKGLLSQMLSLPENWDYTLKGLSLINRESVDAIRTAVIELEKAKYITRQQGRDNGGKMAGIVYTIYEQPQEVSPLLGFPISDKPITEKPTSENPTQINIDILKKDLLNTDLSKTYPFFSDNETPKAKSHAEGVTSERNGTEAFTAYEKLIKSNIEYDFMAKRFDIVRLDEIVTLMLETVCTSRKTIRVAGDDFPAEIVKSKLLKLNSQHIEFVFDCMKENTTKIRNIKKYLLAVLFNAPSTIDGYYTALVNHDMNGG